ncbi:MAG: triose-phosphate isomerase [Proteobacteria bacterium]|nr:triose-phosphate isomerase [Pseudomonadota bacterium]
MSRRIFVAGNWKLNLGPADAAALARALRSSLANRGSVDVAVFPTALSVASVVPVLRGTGIAVGVQEINSTPSGAFTGENSPLMAREAGCTHALIGHSERRQLFGETDDAVNTKVHAAIAAGLLPIMCIGETLDERKQGLVETVVYRQLSLGLADLQPDQVATITLAYEPVWAIGTGVTATPEQAQEVHASIREWLKANYPSFVANNVRIQYGGSVKPKNAKEILSCPDIDGCLVGGASLKADSFTGIVEAGR